MSDIIISITRVKPKPGESTKVKMLKNKYKPDNGRH